jgi:two-component system, OmpR family, sensor histidine kinase ChvG
LWSPTARLILASNLAGLIVLILGALLLNELRSSLVDARKLSLYELSRIISSQIVEQATDDSPRLLEDDARYELKRIAIAVGDSGLSDDAGDSRMRIYNSSGEVVADTAVLRDEIDERDLPDLPSIRQPSGFERGWLDFVRGANSALQSLNMAGRPEIAEARSLEEEIAEALTGNENAVYSERFGDQAERVLSLTVPIKRVGGVVGTLTIETGDVGKIIAAERAALIPLIIFAVLTAIATSALLTIGIARPMRKLALASEHVRTGVTEKLDLGSLHKRKDEFGDLARAMEAMTEALYNRIQSNERFAADVAHELKNPLTSIRSAVETSQAVKDPEVREKLREVIARDVIRLDRLLSDISNLSRLEGEIVREKLERVDLARLLGDIVSIYRDTSREGDAKVTLEAHGRFDVMGREGPLAQVIRNLVENARSFSPPGGEVKVQLSRTAGVRGPIVRMIVDDNGPGVPPDKLEKIFERFYTDRPQGAKFGNNSGLGLSIVKQIVETHRGRVWAENRMVQDKVAGARVIVELPPAPLEL